MKGKRGILPTSARYVKAWDGGFWGSWVNGPHASYRVRYFRSCGLATSCSTCPFPEPGRSTPKETTSSTAIQDVTWFEARDRIALPITPLKADISVNTASFVRPAVTRSAAELDSDNTLVCHTKVIAMVYLTSLKYHNQSCLLLPPTMQKVSNAHAMPDSSNDATASGQSSPFLELPGELRNRIYRMATVSRPRAFGIDNHTGLTEPGLLLASHRVRNEAIDIFCCENIFLTLTPDYDASVIMKWEPLVDLRRKTHDLGLVRAFIASSAASCTPNWTNLLKWLRSYHNGDTTARIPPLSAAHSKQSTESLVIGGMFTIVSKMMDQPWVKVETLLKEHRYILIRLDGRWEEGTVAST